MNYEQALEYIHSITWRGSRPGLSRTQELLDKIGNPERAFKAVHIVGTNGKGSTSAFIESVLRCAGYKTGLYTSPYIWRFNERIRFCGDEISDSDLAEVTEFVKPFAEEMIDPPTEFELITAIGFEYFRRKGCDIAVIEAGMGGEFDSTNVIPSPLVSVITAIGLDHTKELGSTYTAIATTKAGIIKEGTRAVSYGENDEAYSAIKSKCDSMGVTLSIPSFDDIKVHSSDIFGSNFSYGKYDNLKIKLVGEYQMKNAVVAVTAIEELRKCGVNIPDKMLYDGLASASWAGRFEVLMNNPVFISDGAHNPHGMVATVSNIKSLFADKKIAIIMGVMADKDYPQMLDLIKDVTAKLYTVTPDNPRALPAASLAEAAGKHGIISEPYGSVYDAAHAALKEQGARGTICAFGSLYMYKEVKDAAESLYK
ncbi:MAG: bifunctional folylpolyglutamate synthase/dihydrofolate synthase [Ruminococcaceae bacterium]|nr:bifunctional folylpolyglutamate synthase/dihydrofolate synthase [Oscillospiraceae bacterium]